MKRRKTWILLRCFLLLLICLQLALIFGFSAENAKKSGETSTQVAEEIAKVVVEDFEELPEEEQQEVVQRIDPPVRKVAHATEFGVLGGLFFLLFLTFPLPMWASHLLSIFAAAIFGALDEWHQTFVPGRSGRSRDVLIDTSGAILVCSILLLLAHLLKKNRKKIKVTTYSLRAPLQKKIAIVSDLHGEPAEPVIGLLKQAKPDLILVPGDLADREDLEDETARAFTFLKEAALLAPTYYSLGNHEVDCHRNGFHKNRVPVPLPETARENLAKTGAILLENGCAYQDGLSICGLTSNGGGKGNAPWNDELAKRFEAMPGYKILLCHHPEQFDDFVAPYSGVDLTISGHAHGGQWRVFGQGIYAPDQGLFPRYTKGFYHGKRLLVSRGLGDATALPRIFNPRELVILELDTQK